MQLLYMMTQRTEKPNLLMPISTFWSYDYIFGAFQTAVCGFDNKYIIIVCARTRVDVMCCVFEHFFFKNSWIVTDYN